VCPNRVHNWWSADPLLVVAGQTTGKKRSNKEVKR
jgi:hypothetical protein